MLYDFHTHTFLSDGELSPIELIRRAFIRGYQAIALTDHVSLGSLHRVIPEVARECALAREHWNIAAIPGVELTHLPAPAIPEAARKAKELGAWLVVVHGETIVEPVEKGTNTIALSCPYVDILAHPGLLTPEEAQLAARNGIFLEISLRRGHCLTNGHIAQLARRAGAKLLISSDAHIEEDLLNPDLVSHALQGAALRPREIHQVLESNPQLLLHHLPLAPRAS